MEALEKGRDIDMYQTKLLQRNQEIYYMEYTMMVYVQKKRYLCGIHHDGVCAKIEIYKQISRSFFQ